jgi:hypothetical protein
MTGSEYTKAYKAAKAELENLLARHREDEKRIAQLRQMLTAINTIRGVADPTIYPMPKLTRGIRTIFHASERGQLFTAPEVRDVLVAQGLDTKKYKNVLASIHTVLKRLETQGEIEKTETGWMACERH